MKKLLVAGPTRLSGTVRIHGAKNSVLPILAACCLCCSPCVLHNCPDIADVRTALAILESLGLQSAPGGEHAVHRPYGAGPALRRAAAGWQNALVSSIPGGFAGALFAGGAGAPGGCPLGDRPIDLHVKALSQLGVRFCFEEGRMRAVWHKRLDGDIRLPLPSVGATENLLLACALGKRTVNITGAAREPEIADLIGFLRAAGADISAREHQAFRFAA